MGDRSWAGGASHIGWTQSLSSSVLYLLTIPPIARPRFSDSEQIPFLLEQTEEVVGCDRSALALNEAFEALACRLFSEVHNPSEGNRTCKAFSRMYSGKRRNYPQGAGQPASLERRKACYPIDRCRILRFFPTANALSEQERMNTKTDPHSNA